jgi:uncharacterized protein (DUF2147 family)
MSRFSLIMTMLLTAASAPPDPAGLWLRADGNAYVRIAPCGTEVCATNTWIKDPGTGEAVGDRLIMDLAPRTGNVLAGTAYDPKRGMTYAVTVTVGPAGLTTRGCLLFGLLCRSVTWSRVRTPAS